LDSDEFKTLAYSAGTQARAYAYEISAIKSGVCDLNHPAVDIAAATLEAERKLPFCEVRHARYC
jgi:hypothetical protein